MNEDKEIQEILKKLSEKNKETNLLTHIANQNFSQDRHKYLTMENLIQELFLLKGKKNEYESVIKMLKVQIRKLERPEIKSEKKTGNLTLKEEMCL